MELSISLISLILRFGPRILVPDVSGQVPCMRPNMFPQALLTAAILARTGRLWITKDTSFLCCLARFCAWPRIPKPVMSVAAWALNVCMSPAAERDQKKNLLSGVIIGDFLRGKKNKTHLSSGQNLKYALISKFLIVREIVYWNNENVNFKKSTKPTVTFSKVASFHFNHLELSAASVNSNFPIN